VRAGEVKLAGDVRAAIDALEAHLESAEQPRDPAEHARLVMLLQDLRSRLPRKARGPSIAAAAVFIVCFVTSAILVWKKVDRAEVDAQIDAGAVHLAPSGQLRSLLQSLPVTEIAPRGHSTLQEKGPAASKARIEKLSCSADCTLLLKGLDLTNVKQLDLRRVPQVGSLGIAATGADLSIQVVAEGTLHAEYEDGSANTLTIDPPGVFTVRGGATRLDFNVITKSAENTPLEPLTVSAIDFDEEIEITNEGRPITVRRSSISKGSVHLRRVDRTTALVRGDSVELHGFEGRLHELLVTPAGFHVALVGRVDDLRIGEERQSLMPSELETLRADSGLAVYWASAMWLAGLLVSILQWFRPRG